MASKRDNPREAEDDRKEGKTSKAEGRGKKPHLNAPKEEGGVILRQYLSFTRRGETGSKKRAEARGLGLHQGGGG